LSGRGRPRVFDRKVKLAVTDELVSRVEAVRDRRAERLGLRPVAADVYREALALGLVQLLAAEGAGDAGPPLDAARDSNDKS